MFGGFVGAIAEGSSCCISVTSRISKVSNIGSSTAYRWNTFSSTCPKFLIRSALLLYSAKLPSGCIITDRSTISLIIYSLMVDANSCPLQLSIMYASELGNCEQISDDLLRNLKKNHGADGNIIGEAKRVTMNNYN